MTNIEKLVQNNRELKAMKTELDAEIKANEAEIKEFLAENNIKQYIGNDFKITLSESERKTLDRKLIEAAFGDMTDYEKVSLVTRLLIKWYGLWGGLITHPQRKEIKRWDTEHTENTSHWLKLPNIP